MVVHAFKQTGFYFLVTFKDTYNPGFAGITVKQAPRALGIKVPDSGLAGEPIDMYVYDRNTGAGVPQAGVWAVSPAAIPVLTTSNQDTVASIMQNGQFIGWTDTTGKLTFKMEKPGQYLLVAVKNGYNPGFAKINIKESKTLVVKAPTVVKVLEPVSIRVLEKSVLTVEIPVAKAGVWAISVNDVATLDNTVDYAAIAQKYGVFLGWTDETGYVNPTPSFHRPGKFWLVSIKEGYQSGFSVIKVEPLAEATSGSRCHS